MIPGRDKPHIYKQKGWWYTRMLKHPTSWQWRKAVAFVEALNNQIRKDNHEQGK